MSEEETGPSTQTEKKCARCRKVQPIVKFKISPKTGKLYAQCDKCNEYKKTHKLSKTVKKIITNSLEKQCSKCKRVESIDDFSINPKTNEYYAQCNICVEYCRKRREKNKKEEIDNSGKKMCSRCGNLLKLTDFSFNVNKDRYNSNCDNCRKSGIIYSETNKEKIKEYREESKEKTALQKKKYREENKEKIAVRGKEYREENKKEIARRRKERREINREEILAKQRTYYEENKLKIREYRRKYDKENRDRIRERDKCEHLVNKYICKTCAPLGHLIHTVRGNISKLFSTRLMEKSKKSNEYLGCTYEFYWEYLESKLCEGMSFDNYGEWEIDHIIPLMYNNPTEEEIIERLHYSNTQPLWAEDNRAKGNKYIG